MKLAKNAVKLVMSIFIKYMIALAVPEIFRNKDIPFPIDK